MELRVLVQFHAAEELRSLINIPGLRKSIGLIAANEAQSYLTRILGASTHACTDPSSQHPHEQLQEMKAVQTGLRSVLQHVKQSVEQMWDSSADVQTWCISNRAMDQSLQNLSKNDTAVLDPPTGASSEGRRKKGSNARG